MEMNMLNIIVRIEHVDMNGYNGREHHPSPEMDGMFARVTNMETIPGDVIGADCEDEHLWYCLLLDANGDALEENAEVELVDDELVQCENMPVLFAELKA